MSSAPEILLQRIVGSWQVFDLITSKKSFPITGRHLAKVRDCLRSLAQLFLFGSHGREQLFIGRFEHRHRVLFFVGQEMSGLVKPLVGLLQRRPERFRGRQSGLQELSQANQFRRKPLFSSIRAIEEVMAFSRSCRRSPAASKGGCPSSVRALRTAKQ